MKSTLFDDAYDNYVINRRDILRSTIMYTLDLIDTTHDEHIQNMNAAIVQNMMIEYKMLE
jgi:hypothetical protein